MPLKMYPSQPQMPKNNISSIVAVAAGKGGVGKSTVTANLALALQQTGWTVGILDADIYGPSMRKMLPEQTPPAQEGEMLIPALCHGIKMMSMAYFRKAHEAAALRAPMVNGIITQFIKNVHWGNLDLLLIDFPPGTGDIQLTLAQQARLSGALLVTTPQEVALLDVRKAAHLFHQVHIPLMGVIENLSYYQPTETSEKVYLFGQGGGARLASELNTPFMGTIPIDPTISRCGDEGVSLFSQEPSSSGKAAFLQLASLVTKQLTKEKGETPPQSIELSWKEMP